MGPETSAFAAWAHKVGEWGERQELAGELEHWLWSGSWAGELPVDGPGGANTMASVAGRHWVELGEASTRELLQEVPRAYRTQINEVLLTALLEALWEWSGEREQRIDLEGHGREDLFPELDLSRTVGWFTTSFPVRLRLEGEGPGAALKAVKEQVRRGPGRGLGYGALRHFVPAEV